MKILILAVVLAIVFCAGVWLNQIVDERWNEDVTAVTTSLTATTVVGPPTGTLGPITTAPLPRYTVTRVWDGDTIRVKLGVNYFNVRFLGIDTPEIHRIGTPVQCGGRAAYLYTKALLPVGTLVVLHGDSTTQDIDKYGRLLRYVFRGRIDVGRNLARNGIAKVYRYRGASVTRTELYQAAENRARAEKKGIWGSPCFGNTTQAQP